jgi:outer membrane protein W
MDLRIIELENDFYKIHIYQDSVSKQTWAVSDNKQKDNAIPIIIYDDEHISMEPISSVATEEQIEKTKMMLDNTSNSIKQLKPVLTKYFKNSPQM